MAHSLPGAMALQLVQLARRWGVSSEQLLSGFVLSEEQLEAPFARVSIPTMNALIERARMLTGEPGLGFYMGLQKRITLYGSLGFATMNAATLGEALELAERYAPAVSTAIAMRLRVEGGMAALVFEPQCQLGSAHDVALLSLLVGLGKLGDALTGRELTGTIEVTIPEPPYYKRFAHIVPELRFGEPINQIVFDARQLELPLVAPDRAAMRLAREHCEQQMLALGLHGNVLERVRRVMLTPAGPETFEEVASALHMSPRTLRRRLVSHGATFSELRARVCCERAVVLLRSRELSIEAVARELGYSTLSGFVRAFHRWTGQTPAAYRRERLAQPEVPAISTERPLAAAAGFSTD